MKKLALLVSLALSACGGFSIRNIDNPPSCPYYDEWITPSISGRCPTAGQPRRLTPEQKQQVLEINKALLECGKPHYSLT
ncbi:hypothetical protein FACS189475_00180 [Betaproteobacteria bacterium]|nr:hypothetical protein FACS189475_00180 [Betaproteobacteria bacterium]